MGNANQMLMAICKPDGSKASIVTPMDVQSHPPFPFAERVSSADPGCPCNNQPQFQAQALANVCDKQNVNLTPAQKLLKLDHNHLGHVSFK